MVKVLVTGGNGFIAAHIVNLLLERGDDVVVTVRSEDSGQNIVQKHANKAVHFYVVKDITNAEAVSAVFSTHSDIHYVLHTASPFKQAWADAVQDMLNPAIQGTREILRSVKKHALSVKRVVVLSSIVSMMTSGTEAREIDESSWNPVTWEGAISNPRLTYIGSKTLAEKAAWTFMEEEQPKFDLVTINPPLVFGPLAHELPSLEHINTSNLRILALVQGKFREAPLPPTVVYTWVDVRDLALAHLRAMDVEEAGGHRIAIVAGYFSNKTLADTIAETHPELQDKLPVNAVDDAAANQFLYSGTKAIDLLGITYRSFTCCVDEAVTSLQKHGA